MAALRANAAIDGGGIVVCHRRRRTSMMAMAMEGDADKFLRSLTTAESLVVGRTIPQRPSTEWYYQTVHQTKAW